MTLNHRPATETDFWRTRNFLRAVYLHNNRHEHSWHVARLDHWHYHFGINLGFTGPLEHALVLWEDDHGEIVAAITRVDSNEVRLHVHPAQRTPALEHDLLDFAEAHYVGALADGTRVLYSPLDATDDLRRALYQQRGYVYRNHTVARCARDLTTLIPATPTPPGYEIRALAGDEELPARTWASWRAFHPDEPDSGYDPDVTWYRTIQSAPLYRRDLDLVAITPSGEIASFVTISYDDYTRSAVCIMVGTAADHWRRGLASAVLTEGFHRLQRVGATRVCANGGDPPAEALYRSVMPIVELSETWRKTF